MKSDSKRSRSRPHAVVFTAIRIVSAATKAAMGVVLLLEKLHLLR
jgi:hypothetical protein